MQRRGAPNLLSVLAGNDSQERVVVMKKVSLRFAMLPWSRVVREMGLSKNNLANPTVPNFVFWSRRPMLSLGSSNAITKSLPAKPASPPGKALPARQPSPREEGPYVSPCTPSLLNRGETLITLSRVPSSTSFCGPACRIWPTQLRRRLPPLPRCCYLPWCSSTFAAGRLLLKLPHHSLALLWPEFRARI